MAGYRSFSTLTDFYSAVSVHELDCGVKFVCKNNTKLFGTECKSLILQLFTGTQPLIVHGLNEGRLPPPLDRISSSTFANSL